MKKGTLSVLLALMLTLSAQAGLGIQIGALSPNTALKDNDNSLMLGLDYTLKFAVLGLKIEGFYVDSEGRYSKELGNNADHFAEATINIEGLAAADLLYYPLATTFFLEAGVNYTALDASDLVNIDGDAIDNKLGVNLGAGITLFDKLLVQAKVLYTPDALNGSAADALDIKKDLFGYMATAGWRF